MEILPHIGIFIPILPSLIALLFWKRLNHYQKWFGIMLWVISIVSILGRLWTLLGYSNNLPFFHIYILIEMVFLLFLFREILSSFLSLRVWKSLLISFLALWVYNILWGDGWLGYPALIHGVEALLVIGLVLSWFVKILQEKVVRNVTATFELWFCVGLLLFFSTNLLLFLFSSYVVAQNEVVFKTIWQVHALMAILLYIIYSIALLCAVKTPK